MKLVREAVSPSASRRVALYSFAAPVAYWCYSSRIVALSRRAAAHATLCQTGIVCRQLGTAAVWTAGAKNTGKLHLLSHGLQKRPAQRPVVQA